MSNTPDGKDQAFLLKLSDTLRAETGVEAVGNRATQLIAERLGADRVYLVTLNPDDDTVVVTQETRRPDMPPLQGAYRSSDFPAATKEIFERTIVYTDVRTDARLTELERRSFAGLGAVGFMAASVRRGSQTIIWAAGTLSTQPRAWTTSEVTLFEDAVERTWAAVERARADEALRESEERLQLALKGSSIFTWEVDPKTGYTHYSANFNEVLGFEMSTIAQENFINIYPDDKDFVTQAVGQALTGEAPLDVEHRIIHPRTGALIWVRAQGQLTKRSAQADPVFIGVTQNITTHKEAENALHKLEQRNRLALEAAQMATWEWDLTTDQVYWNEQHFYLLGMAVQPNPLPADAFRDHLHPDDAESIQAQLKQAIVQRSLYDAEFRIIRDDGVVRWMSGYGQVVAERDSQPVRVSGVMFDITDTKQALRQSEEQFRLLGIASSDSLYKMSPDWTQMRQLIGKSFLVDTADTNASWLQTYIPLEDQGQVQQVIQAAIQTKSNFELEHHVRRADGTIGWTSSRAIPVLDEQGQIQEWLGAASDITPRKQAEQALRDSEARLQLALGAAQLGTFVWYLTEDRTEADALALAHFGLPPDTQATLADSLANIFHPEDGPRYVAAIAQATDPAGSGTMHQEFRIRRSDGERWMSVIAMTVFEGSPPVATRITGVLADITERKQAAAALYHSEARLRAILESAKDYAIFTTDLHQRVTSWNPGAQALFGYSEAAILGQPVDWLYNPQDRKDAIPQQEAKTAIETGRFDNERWHSRQDGSLFYGSGVVTPLRDESGVVIGLLKVMRDLTQQKRAEQALQQADQRKDEFLAMLAHELRNPMSTIHNGLQVLSLTVGADAMSADTVAMMNRQTDHLVRLVDDLLDVSRISQGKIELKKQRVDLVAIISQAVESVQASYQQQGRSLHVDLPTQPIYLDGDATRLTQVVTNLLTNGARYTGERGQVWLSLTHNQKEAILQVRDNGIGLAADQLSAIFELFVQVDNSLARSKGGLGLGLTLVKRLVEMHGGQVTAQSAGLGQGSTFQVYLPSLETALKAEPKPLQGTTSQASRGSILVIDDNADAAFTLAMLLKLKGYEAHTRTNGRAGVEAAEALHPAAILLDIGMPDLDGYATCRLLREQPWGKSVPVIALTGYGQEEDRQQSREAGFDGHLVKPVDLGALTTLLTDLLEKR